MVIWRSFSLLALGTGMLSQHASGAADNLTFLLYYDNFVVNSDLENDTRGPPWGGLAMWVPLARGQKWIDAFGFLALLFRMPIQMRSERSPARLGVWSRHLMVRIQRETIWL
jgi:hypothetical protein